MADFVLSCCSTADLTKEHFQQRDISYICFHYALDGVDYPDDLGETMPFDKFYAAMANGAETRTSQVNISEFVDYFTPFLEQGKDILHVCLSSGLSGVSNSAENAARIVRERYPDRKIYIVDSLGASSGYGLLMDKLADLRDEGMSIDAVRDWAEAHKLELHHWFFSTDLTFYVKGGRISKVAGVFGGLLDICPLLNMDNLGRLIPRSKIRGKKRVLKELPAWKSMRRAASTTPASATSRSRRAMTMRAPWPTRSKRSSRSSTARSRSTASAPPLAAIPVRAPWPCSSGATSARTDWSINPPLSFFPSQAKSPDRTVRGFCRIWNGAGWWMRRCRWCAIAFSSRGRLSLPAVRRIPPGQIFGTGVGRASSQTVLVSNRSSSRFGW